MKFLHNRVNLIIGFCLAATLSVQAQYSLIKSADREFDAFNFIAAIELYSRAYETKPATRTAERLAEAYFNIRDYQQAEAWYARLANEDDAKGEHILRYGHVLRNNSKFKEAKAQYQRVANKGDVDTQQEQLNILIASCDSAIVWMQNPEKAVDIKNMRWLNSPQSEFGATVGPQGFYFASDRIDGAENPNIIYGWTGNPYMSLYKAEGDTIARVSSSWDRGASHFGPATFSEVRNEVYFALTRQPTREERKRKRDDVTVNIEIFSSALNAENWGEEAKPFRYNNITEWSVGDPFLTASGDTLYFASDMPGGYGGTDIYYVVRRGDGDWGEAINMGQRVNTAGDERFPSVSEDGVFYFSSNGHLGMGGLDVFRVENHGNVASIENLGFPFNSPHDDFSIRFVQGKEGYFASNRMGGTGSDDIYWFNLDKVLQLDLSGGVYNAKTKLPVSGALVTLTPLGDETEAITLNAERDGKFRFNLSADTDYLLLADQTGFRPMEPLRFTTKGIDSSATFAMELFLQPVEVEEVVVLRNIYFDFDDATIRPDAAIELDKIAAFLDSDPSVRIELSAHTDSRGTHAYNMGLSQRRADAAVAYLVSRGIASERLVAKGYGFTKLANACDKGVECTEEEHQWNRRVEFFVIEN